MQSNAVKKYYGRTIAQNSDRYSAYMDRVKQALIDWGKWHRYGNSLRFLGASCVLSKLLEAEGKEIPLIDEPQCESIHKAYLQLKKQDYFSAKCLFLYYVKNKTLFECSMLCQINKNTFISYLKQGEGFIAGSLRSK